jgi:hypothetical protein
MDGIKTKLTLWSWVPLERPHVVQLLGSLTAFYGTHMFITAFTRAYHFYLSWARPIQSTQSNPISKSPSYCYLSTDVLVFLVLSFLLACLPITYYAFLFFPIRAACPAHFILLDLIIRMRLSEEYNSCGPSLCSFSTRWALDWIKRNEISLAMQGNGNISVSLHKILHSRF